MSDEIKQYSPDFQSSFASHLPDREAVIDLHTFGELPFIDTPIQFFQLLSCVDKQTAVQLYLNQGIHFLHRLSQEENSYFSNSEAAITAIGPDNTFGIAISLAKQVYMPNSPQQEHLLNAGLHLAAALPFNQFAVFMTEYSNSARRINANTSEHIFIQILNPLKVLSEKILATKEFSKNDSDQITEIISIDLIEFLKPLKTRNVCSSLDIKELLLIGDNLTEIKKKIEFRNKKNNTQYVESIIATSKFANLMGFEWMFDKEYRQERFILTDKSAVLDVGGHKYPF